MARVCKDSIEVDDEYLTQSRKELNSADLALARVERLFYSALRKVHSDGWGTHVCDLHDALLTSRDILKLKGKQAKQWFCQEKRELHCGANAKEQTLFFMSSTSNKSEKETRREKKKGTKTEVFKKCQQGIKGKKRRSAQTNKRKRDKQLIDCFPVTPPTSPPHDLAAVVNQQGRVNTMRRNGREKIKRDRAKVYRTIEKLKVKLFQQTRLLHKMEKEIPADKKQH